MKSARIRVLLLALGDMLLLGCVWLGCAFLYWRFWYGDYTLGRYFALWPFLLTFAGCNSLIKLYHGNVFYPCMPLSPVEELRRLFFSITVTYLLLLGYLVFTREVEAYSRAVMLTSWLFCCLAASPWRNLLRFVLRRLDIGQIDALIAGGGQTGRMLWRNFENNPYYGIKIAGFFDDDPRAPECLPGWRRLGTLDDAVRVGRKQKISCLICCLPLKTVQQRLKEYMGTFPTLTVVPDNSTLPIAWAYPVDFHGIGGIELRNQILLRGPRLLKKVFELAASFVAILLALPVFLLLALGVKLTSPGPVIYRAKRLGRNGVPFEAFKFRTMEVNADDNLEQILAENPKMAKEWEKTYKLTNDPRVTWFGRILRRTSLDELPQLFNVLRGEMALIGPRPIVQDEVSYYGEHYQLVASVTPGLTGLWQISGRSDTNYEQRVIFDTYYIMNWSIWLDFYILEYTVWETLTGRGAR